ncbi:NAD/NADP-dependent betaine aldehyde dehydrogenase [bacterium HR30]|nr:NAD/NADP-dependent betaine aldehyde dehydrogenase [bacterium HR30]
MIDHASARAKLPFLPTPRLFIGGDWQAPHGSERIAVQDPTTGEVWGEIAVADQEDVDKAVNAARTAYERHWGRAAPSERRRVLQRLAEVVDAHRDELATLESLDVGMVQAVARSFGVKALVRNLEYYASWCDKIYGCVVPLPGKESALDYWQREPYGVVAAITAWNTPLVFIGSKVGPALATGNTVVVKPSELGSVSTLRFAALCQEADVPPGVINVVTGAASTGQSLLQHPGVDKISFTGGCATGRRVAELAGRGLKKLTLELGGKSPQLIFPDAALDRAVAGVALGGLALSGQACAAGTRILVHESIYGPFVERLVSFCRGLPLGDPLSPSTVLGPLISEEHRQRVEHYVALAERDGVTFHCKGERGEGDLSSGFFLSPTIVSGVRPESRVAHEEIFGPVLAVFTFREEEEAVALANSTRYGLAAGVWTTDLARAHRVSASLQAGVVWVNSYGNLPYTVPFGGFKDSGWGREAGREALLEYTQIKNVFISLA